MFKFARVQCISFIFLYCHNIYSNVINTGTAGLCSMFWETSVKEITARLGVIRKEKLLLKKLHNWIGDWESLSAELSVLEEGEIEGSQPENRNLHTKGDLLEKKKIK